VITDLTTLTLLDARAALRAREVSAVELAEAYLARIEAVESKVRAFVTVTPDLARAQAEAADARRAAGEDGPLLGLPIALKDLLCTAGVRTTCASRILESFVPPFNATVVERLQAAGTVVLGKTNLDEFAMGSSTENSAFHPTHNPWDLARVPGGSSGGSAAAVAAAAAPASLGTDTGGSIRQPAALCGVVGLKPTYGRVSRFGLVAFASSLDQIGPFARTAADCALLLGAIAGHDPADATSLPEPVPDYLAELDGSAGAEPSLQGLRVGVPREYFAAGIEPGVEAAVRAAIDRLAALGADVGEVSLPHTDYGVAVYYLVAPAEASANLARYDGVKYGYSVSAATLLDGYFRTRGEGFGTEVKRRIMLGTYALSAGYYDAYYRKAQQVRTLIKDDFDRAFAQYDVLVAPTSPTVAFRLGERMADPLAMYLSDICTIPVNLAGIPGLSLPCGFADDLPVGLQLIGPPLAEGRLLHVAHQYQQVTDWHRRVPAL
jgi:aspartyl-tRNA(Asn)/glutamyl-tRNA(Gln) amidotransferase subunit A